MPQVQRDCFCSLNLLFCGVVVAVAVVVAYRLPIVTCLRSSQGLVDGKLGDPGNEV